VEDFDAVRRWGDAVIHPHASDEWVPDDDEEART
jgi:hypothetical protein